MKLTEFLSNKIIAFVILICSIFSISGLLLIFEIPTVFIVIIIVLSSAPITIYFVIEFANKKNFYNDLYATLANMDQKTLVSELITEPTFFEGKILLDLLKICNKYQNDMIAEATKKNREYREFLDIWVHEIKTPIASARLIVENEKNSVTLRIDDELRKIDNFVELVLFYARSTSVEKDFKVSETTIQDMVETALKIYSKFIIQAKGNVVMQNLDLTVIADVKWSSFIIGQVISNSIKYSTNNLNIKFSAEKKENSACLTIEDNGIGIPNSDLGRIFDKGFTGENGRKFTKSTGLGLYLCKLLCKKMNIIISVKSTVGVGTSIQLDFPTESKLLKVGK